MRSVQVLVDTNVISELMRPIPDLAVVEFLNEHLHPFLSVISLHELHYGSQCHRDPIRRRKLNAWTASIRKDFKDRLLSIGPEIAEKADQLRADDRLRGRVLHLDDALIAATALHHGLTLATRNVRDFEMTGVSLLNPWGSEA